MSRKNVLVNTTIADINLHDNIYPSVKSMYKDMNVSSDIAGEYMAKKWGFKFENVSEDEIMYLNTLWGWHKILYPKNPLSLVTLDETIILEYILDATDSTPSPNLNWFGNELDVEKIK